MRHLEILALCALLPSALPAQWHGPAEMPAAASPRAAPTAMGLAGAPPEPAASLLPAKLSAPRLLEEAWRWNASGRLPWRDGVVRALPSPLHVELPTDLAHGEQRAHAGGVVARTPEGDLVWAGRLQVLGASELRARLERVRLPAGTDLWVHGEGEEPRHFGLELLGPEAELWTPTVTGETLSLEVRVPARRLRDDRRFRFAVTAVVESLPHSGAPPFGGLATRAHDTCLQDAICLDGSTLGILEPYRRAVAQLRFTSEGSSYLCTGALLNDADPTSFAPLLLTAHHCISTAAQAASVEARWDFHPPACGAPLPPPGTVPRSHGATLLATGTGTDFTLLRLNSVPSGRHLLGWDARPVAQGTVLHRISHPAPHSMLRGQSYSRSVVESGTLTCAGTPHSRYLYSRPLAGGTFGGSSGAPAVLANGLVVGQLRGGCGDTGDPGDGCNYGNYDIDGALSATYPAISPWLNPTRGQELSLLRGRFRVAVDWHNQFNDQRGVGVPLPASDLGGYFYFTDPSNIELMIKMLDFGDRILFFYGQLTNLRFTLTVHDTATGTVKTYANGPNDCGAIDANAFPAAGRASGQTALAFELVEPGPGIAGHVELAPPAPGLPTMPGRRGSPAEQRLAPAPRAAASCAPSAHRLCLLGSRIAVELSWRNQFNGASGAGRAEPLSSLTGSFAFDDPANLEVLVKALDFGDRVLVLWGALSNLEYTLTVTDTSSGAFRIYHNPPGIYCGGLDERAF
jgi:hypothetical protein